MSESWYKNHCPKCKAVNWVNNGDETDITAIDIEGYKCRKCKEITYIGFDYEWDSEQGCWESIEDCNWELGLETPN